MRQRPDPLHLAFGAIAIGMVVLLTGVTLAWRSSGGQTTGLGTGAGVAVGADTTLPVILEPVPSAGPVVPTTLPAPAGPPSTEAATSPPPSAAPATQPAKPPTVSASAGTGASKGATASTAPFFGMGTWVDVFDWAPSYSKGRPVQLVPGAVDAMADQGVQVLYIQTTRADYAGPGDIVDPGVLQQWLARAQARGLQVVAWYLPTLTDVGADLRRLKATAGLATVDGIGVDIESKAVVNHDERSRRLVELSRQARSALAGRPLSAITLPNVVTDVISPNYWPRFPWAEIRPYYDVWQPMGYWTNRKASSPYRNAELYTRENIERMRTKLGDPDAVVHPIGGIGDKTTPADIDGFLNAVRQTRSIGASLYDWKTQSTNSYTPMRAARS
ncbi:MAG: hypothetical protein WKF86_01530 [Acidimicrobiales bacterium]